MLPLIPLAMAGLRVAGTGLLGMATKQGLASLAGGAIGSAVAEGGLNAIADAVVSAPSEDEARRAVGGSVNIEVAKLMRSGMSLADAEKQVNDKVSEMIQEHIAKGGVPEWAHTAIGVVGGIGGFAAGAKLAGKGLARMASKAVAGEAGAGAAKAASLADAAIEDPLKKAAAKAVAPGSGKAAEGAAKKAVPEEAGESAAMNTPKEEMGEYALKGEAYGPFPTKTKVGGFSIDAPSGRNQHGMEFRMKDGMSGEAPVPTDYSHGMRGGMPTAGDAGAFKVREGVGNSVPLTSDYGESMGPFPSVRRIRADGTRGQDSIDRSMRTARNRNRGVFDELDAANDAEKQAQIEAMNASGRVARKPAYHSRDSVDSAVSQDDLDNLVFRLGR